MKPQPKCVSMEEMSPLLLGLIDEGVDVNILVTGNSMRPMLTHLKSTVTLTKCDPKSLKKGDIPLYRRENGQYVLHRIVRVHKSTYDIIGDHQTEIERDVPKENVLCVVKEFTHKGKTYSCVQPCYRMYAFLWRWSVPFRGIMLKTKRFFVKFFKRKKV